ncbi:TetR/AcrR family transcriptional regulator [Streptomyces sp. NPDC020875]|uniref:TetR/AcrR family transcriptional regulator n=1 Tax=Streptomyces sp. NPDC020875 TaxID=3154898 RepID=UPI0034114FF2
MTDGTAGTGASGPDAAGSRRPGKSRAGGRAGSPGGAPGRPRSLTARAVAEAALAEGLADFSMPGVAARLGVSHSTLYRYVQDRDDLVRTAIGLAVEGTHWPEAGLPWRDLLVELADRIWELCDAHPGFAQAVLTTPGTPPAIVERLIRYARSLVAAGLTDREAVVSVDFVAELVLSTWIAMRHLDRETTAGSGRTVREEYRDTWSAPTPFSAEFTAEATWHGRGWFADKLDIYLDGLALRIGTRSAAADGRDAGSG